MWWCLGLNKPYIVAGKKGLIELFWLCEIAHHNKSSTMTAKIRLFANTWFSKNANRKTTFDLGLKKSNFGTSNPTLVKFDKLNSFGNIGHTYSKSADQGLSFEPSLNNSSNKVSVHFSIFHAVPHRQPYISKVVGKIILFEISWEYILQVLIESFRISRDSITYLSESEKCDYFI